MDSDLAEAVAALKAAFDQRKTPAQFGQASKEEIESLRKSLKIPSRFRSFLAAANPVDVETITPVERVRLIPADKIYDEQVGFAVPLPEGASVEGSAPAGAWRKTWIIIGRSALLGDPYFLDIAKLDAEGDCPIFAAMTGTETLKPILCASSLQQFLRILAVSMEVASGFGEAILDDDDERTFREALAPHVKGIDPAALRSGHWT